MLRFGLKISYIQVSGSNKQYHMISTVNMPINSEAENKYMLFDRRNFKIVIAGRLRGKLEVVNLGN
jgi:hypothetical protein